MGTRCEKCVLIEQSMGTSPSKPTNPDILDYLQEITEEEKSELFDLISNDQEERAIQLACRLINRKRKGPRHGVLGILQVPSRQCNEYGVYMYSLFKDVYWHSLKYISQDKAGKGHDTPWTVPIPAPVGHVGYVPIDTQ